MWKINLHFINHLCQCIANYGPLPVQTAYFTENTMGLISRRVMTGTNVSQQVMKKCITYQSVVSSCTNSQHQYSKLFLERLHDYFPKISPLNNLKVRTGQTECTLTEQEALLLTPYTQDSFKSCERIQCKGTIVCTKSYNETTAKSTLNHCIKSEKSTFFVVSKILKADGKVFFLCHEFLNVKKLPLYSYVDKANSNLTFSYMYILILRFLLLCVN